MTLAPPTTDPPPARWGVYRRERGGRWKLLVHAGAEDAARRAMLALMAARPGSADWRVSRVTESAR